jgi:RND family efflux transporter MFP subunit
MKKHMIYRYSIFVWILIGLTSLICGCENPTSQEESSTTVSKVIEQPPTVKVSKVKRGDIAVPILSTGTIFPEHESKIGPKISGTIEIVYVDEGDQVKKGQTLAQMDQKNLQIAVRQCKAAVRVAEAQLKEAELKEINLRKEKKRLANLLEKNAISRQRYDDIDTAHSMALTRMELINAQILSARENLAMAKQKLRDTKIVSPFAGLIVKRFINQGEFVSTMPPTPLFLIMNIDNVKMEVGLTEIHLANVAIGNPVEITVDTYPGVTFKGKISTINPMVDPGSRAFKVKVEFPNKDHRLKSGMFARARIYPRIHKDVLIIPFKSVIKSGGGTFVFIADGDIASSRAVRVGITNEEEIEVIDGLREGDEVVIEGHYGMADKTQVRVLRD